MKAFKATEYIETLPNGTVFLFNRRLYWLCNGLDDRIIMDIDGNWKLAKEQKGKASSIRVMFKPKH